ncbi:MAG: pirin family protein [Pirellulales bacterium]|nr:pirin family protein [Pirellulales bacterium]
MKAIREITRNVPRHWVGDGFPVRSLFSYHNHPEVVSPFLLLDYAGPYDFAPAQQPRGVGEHPHRGFETVTIVYQGELEHRDSAGNHGRIGPGDVQWMTAASGVVHEEFHQRDFTQRGGTLEMVQLWVNLPARWKMSAPRYQEIVEQQIPTVELPGDAGSARVIAGELLGTPGPAQTFTPVHLWDLRLRAGKTLTLPVTDGYTALLVVQRGSLVVNGEKPAQGVDLVGFDRRGDSIELASEEDTMALLLSGQPIDEPVVGHGPFVMNSEREIRQAFADYQQGRMGSLA